MKKLFLFIAFAAFSFGVSAQSSTLKTSPGALAFGSLNACYEKVISDKASVQASASAWFGVGDLDGTAIGLGLGYRMYITKKEAPRGFYAMPRVGLNFGDNASSVGLGVDLGYQWVWDSGFVLDIGLGPQYLIATADDVHETFDGILPNIVLAVGYAF